MKRLSSLFLVILIPAIFTFSHNAKADFVFTPISDATVGLVPPMTYYGQTKNFITNPIARSFLKFDLSSLADDDVIFSATLYAYQYSGARILPISSGTNLHFVESDSWDDSWNKPTGITWGNQPAYSVLLGNNPNSGKHKGWSAWSLTLDPALLSDDVWSMVLVEQYVSRINEHDFYSREYGLEPGEDSSLRPFLALTTLFDDPPILPTLCPDPFADPHASVPEPCTLLLVGCALAGLAGVRRFFPHAQESTR